MAPPRIELVASWLNLLRHHIPAVLSIVYKETSEVHTAKLCDAVTWGRHGNTERTYGTSTYQSLLDWFVPFV